MNDLAPGSLTDVRGLQVGHAADELALTGCSVVLCPEGATAGGSVRGAAPGTRETDLLRAGTLVEKVNGIVLTGGSAFGLAAADGVMRYLEEQGSGYDAGAVRVPIVPGAVIFDLAIGDPAVRPDAAMGYEACRNASSSETRRGNVGAGTGATVGKLMGATRATKAGLGMASLRVGRLVVAAMMVVNAFGDVIDPRSDAVIAGARSADGARFVDTRVAMRSLLVRTAMTLKNTIIGVVATNGRLDVVQANQIAIAAHDGIARVVRPAHSLFDGDTVFALSTGQVRVNQVLVSALAAEVTALAILNGVWSASSAGGLPSARSCSEGA